MDIAPIARAPPFMHIPIHAQEMTAASSILYLPGHFQRSPEDC